MAAGLAGQQDQGPRAVLWDLDGTLVDTDRVHWLAWREVLAREGYDLTWETFAPTFGLRNDQALPVYLPGITDDEIARIGEAKEEIFRALLAEGHLDPLPGARDCLGALAVAGWRQALATMAPRLNLEAILRALGLEQYFGATIGAEDVALGKPDPGVFLLAAARLGVPPGRCIVVEDSPAGVEAARRAAMRCIAVKRRAGNLRADLVVDGLERLDPDAFECLLGRP